MDKSRTKFREFIGGPSQRGKSSHLEPPETLRELSCLAEGDPTVFLVSARNGSDLLQLKKLFLNPFLEHHDKPLKSGMMMYWHLLVGKLSISPTPKNQNIGRTFVLSTVFNFSYPP